MEWRSTLWSNGIVRTIKEKQIDPYDPNLEYTDGDPQSPLTINGNGTATCKLPSTSYRLYVKGPWCNTEQIAYIKINKTARDVQLHSRSSHSLGGPFAIPLCKFGGYHVIWDRKQNKAMVECEVLDHIIARDLASKDIPHIPSGKWVGFKQITRNTPLNYVKIEGYLLLDVSTTNWTKSVEFTFTGSNRRMYFDVLKDSHDRWYSEYIYCKNQGNPPATDLKKYTCWNKPEQMCWIRINDAENVDIKNWSIKEIPPIQ